MLSHLDKNNQPQIVDITGKEITKRTAHARCIVRVPAEIAALFRDGDIHSKKGPVFQSAILAGIMAAKKTGELIPLCHPIGLEDCKIDIAMNPSQNEIIINCRTTVHHKTGVEMEALTGASVAALTIYDMCKGVSHDMIIGDLQLIKKTGGKSDYLKKV